MKNPISNVSTGGLLATREPTRSVGKSSMRAGGRHFALHTLSASLLLAIASGAHAEPAGGVVTNGTANIATTGVNTTITQTTSNVAINWQSFSIGAGETVQFVQPDSNSVALNRVIGSDPSVIQGSLNANGRVFLLNPNGVLFGNAASVNVGGLIASTMSITDADFMAGNYVFTDAGTGSVVNEGSITAADGGFVALMGRSVSNQGLIAARLGTVALSAGNAVTLDVAGDGLLNVSITQGAVDALVENGGLIRADGGQVLLTARAAGDLLNTVVNNTGVIQAHTIDNRNGSIRLLGDLQSGTVNVGGTLDAGAPAGGVGGSVETSATEVFIDPAALVTTAAADGTSGEWLIGMQDFTVGSA
ncbi:MAG TPA: filamentous hemagglutinin N-terminal domain-containing protein, partial [Lysobacter sp.]|nr:filamentous hemagglutinin N-terminal domain-containing protein [Lysobacter sp.]